MRRALLRCALTVAGLVSLVSMPSAGTSAIDGITMVAFARPANFKVGSWVHYEMTSHSQLGYHSDYDVWLLIAGEEEFWGERCFWLETWTKDHDGDTLYTASLISYAAFGDTAALNQPMWLERKTVTGTDADGMPEVNVGLRDRTALKLAGAPSSHPASEDPTRLDRAFDTLAVDTCRLPVGGFSGPVAREINHTYNETQQGDSTVHFDRVETRLRKLDATIPITRLAREDTDDLQSEDVWMTGDSRGRTRRNLEEARARMVLVGYGDHGLMPRLVSKIVPRLSGRTLRRVTPSGSEPVLPPTPIPARTRRGG